MRDGPVPRRARTHGSKASMDSYMAWARAHDRPCSVLTFDEDRNANGDLVPTVFSRAAVTPGNYAETITAATCCARSRTPTGWRRSGQFDCLAHARCMDGPDQGTPPRRLSFIRPARSSRAGSTAARPPIPVGTISARLELRRRENGTGQTATHAGTGRRRPTTSLDRDRRSPGQSGTRRTGACVPGQLHHPLHRTLRPNGQRPTGRRRASAARGRRPGAGREPLGSVRAARAGG